MEWVVLRPEQFVGYVVLAFLAGAFGGYFIRDMWEWLRERKSRRKR